MIVMYQKSKNEREKKTQSMHKHTMWKVEEKKLFLGEKEPFFLFACILMIMPIWIFQACYTLWTYFKKWEFFFSSALILFILFIDFFLLNRWLSCIWNRFNVECVCVLCSVCEQETEWFCMCICMCFFYAYDVPEKKKKNIKHVLFHVIWM